MAEATSSSLPTPLASVLNTALMQVDSTSSTKRHASAVSDCEFFAPAASSFQPRPYAPNSNISDSRIKPFQFTRSHGRSHDALVPAGMDPHPSDPNVVFIHPPFTTFPNSDSHPDGLSFQAMADNPEWFLDPKDFIHENNSNPHAIPYPPILEPPRGWCPAKKKVLKERGTEGWTKSEEPRLRCTFCRRHYAGVNAKRVGLPIRKIDNPPARAARTAMIPWLTSNLKVLPIHSLKFYLTNRREGSLKDKGRMTPEFKPSMRQVSAGPSASPPLTPQASSDIGNVSIESSGGVPPTPPSCVPLIPPSPYDPLLTPSFRHSPASLPSDQPWRFPSPSHPLHSNTRDLSLSMLVRNLASPLVKGSPSLGASPLVYPPSSSSRFARPETPLNGFKLPLNFSNQTRFIKGRLGSSPLASRADVNRTRRRIEESPLSRGIARSHKRAFSEMTEDWFSETSLPSNELSDPFNSIFPSSGAEQPSPMKRVLEAESPILRSRNSTETKGMGIGLLEPFNLAKKTTHDDDGDINDILDSSSNFGDTNDLEYEKDCEKMEFDVQSSSPSEPQAKRRRLTSRGG
ncbi:hypothetical protein Agabi119p4_566 [Agaricus bisporus var. burnettii]|uniref:Uncharacterized protein n=1 Tax=Agaricus bisporus var. burnettii TaxID=192524 RepID=A0A8H7FB08_AGABI|nr:hypothetical protein Agabi119p4_566 [Agaricus bisporus var. burnettii]